MQLFDIWLQGFDVDTPIQFIAEMFIENEGSKWKLIKNQTLRKRVFKKLTKNEQQELFSICENKANGKQLQNILAEGYIIETILVKAKIFIHSSSYSRRVLFNSLPEIKQIELLTLCENLATNSELLEIWLDGFNINIAFDKLVKIFNKDTNNRKKVFEKLNRENKWEDFLSVLKEQINSLQAYHFWKEGYLAHSDTTNIIYLNKINDLGQLKCLNKHYSYSSFKIQGERVETEKLINITLDKDFVNYLTLFSTNPDNKTSQYLWNLYITFLQQEIFEIIKGNAPKIDIAANVFKESLLLCSSFNDETSYKMFLALLNVIKSINQKVALSFNTLKTQKEKIWILNYSIYQPILQKALSLFTPNYQLMLCLDGYHNSLNKNYVLENIDGFDEILVEKILAIRFEDLNTMIFAKKIASFESEKINDYAMLISFIELIQKYDSQHYETLLGDLLPKITKENQFKLWLDNYLVDFSVESIWEFYHNADNTLKVKILEKIDLATANFLFVESIKNIGIVDNKVSYEKLLAILTLHKTYTPLQYASINIKDFVSINEKYYVMLWLDGHQITYIFSTILAKIKEYKLIQFIDNELFIALETDNAKIVATRLLYLGKIVNAIAFAEVTELLNYLKTNSTTTEYNYLIDWLYRTNSDYCKLMLYIYDFVKPTNAEITKEFTRIFKEQHKRFLVTKAEKERFEAKARLQMPDFQTKWLRNIKPSTFFGVVNDNDGNKIYHTSYENIYFENESFKIKLSETNGEELFSKSKEWGFSKLYFNLLQDYFTHRQLSQYIRVTVNQKNEILTTDELIDDLRELQKNILVVWLRHKKELRDNANKSFDKLDNDLKILSNKDIKRITNEENSECVGYLFDNQPDRFLPIYVLELSANEYSMSSVGSWLFSIPLKNNEVAIVWESVKLDRATHIFKCLEKDYETVLKNIENYLLSENTLKRSRLSSKDAENIALQEELFYETSLQHDWVSDCKNWYADVKMVLEL